MSNELFYGSPSQQQTAATIMRKHPVCVAPETELFTLIPLEMVSSDDLVVLPGTEKTWQIVQKNDAGLSSLCLPPPSISG